MSTEQLLNICITCGTNIEESADDQVISQHTEPEPEPEPEICSTSKTFSVMCVTLVLVSLFVLYQIWLTKVLCPVKNNY